MVGGVGAQAAGVFVSILGKLSQREPDAVIAVIGPRRISLEIGLDRRTAVRHFQGSERQRRRLRRLLLRLPSVPTTLALFINISPFDRKFLGIFSQVGMVF